MPAMTPDELMTELVNTSQNAREVLQKLADYVSTNGSVTWNLAGGVSITVDSLQKQQQTINTQWEALQQDFEENFGGVYSTTLTRGSDNSIASGVLTFGSGHTLTLTYTRTGGLLSSIAWVLKDAGGATLASGTKTINRNASGYITGIS